MLENREERERRELRMTIKQYATYKDLEKEAKKLLNSGRTKEFKSTLKQLNEFEEQCYKENLEKANSRSYYSDYNAQIEFKNLINNGTSIYFNK